MKQTLLIIAILAAAGLIIIKPWARQAPQPPAPQSQTSETKTDEQGAVAVAVTPLDLAAGDWKFKVVMDTHSVELDADMTQSAILKIGSQEFRPAAWEGAPPGGHHREGALIFNNVKGSPGEFKLTIKNIGNIPERIFEWILL